MNPHFHQQYSVRFSDIHKGHCTDTLHGQMLHVMMQQMPNCACVLHIRVSDTTCRQSCYLQLLGHMQFIYILMVSRVNTPKHDVGADSGVRSLGS